MKHSIRHILLVDEPSEEQAILVEAIKSAGYRVFEVSSRDDAMALLGKVSVDLVITELMMPDINGWDLLTDIKAKYPKIHVLVMTGQVSEAGEAILLDRKADGYLVKPVIPERVRVLLRALLEPHNLDRDAEVVLVAEKDEHREKMIRVLGERGLNVFAFDAPKPLLRHIRINPPELVIIDIHVQVNMGLELCRVVRFTPGTVYSPILLIVDKPSRNVIEKAIRLRVNGILARPFEPEELGSRAINMVKQSEARKHVHNTKKRG